jgi:hypothetical protein
MHCVAQTELQAGACRRSTGRCTGRISRRIAVVVEAAWRRAGGRQALLAADAEPRSINTMPSAFLDIASTGQALAGALAQWWHKSEKSGPFSKHPHKPRATLAMLLYATSQA